MTLISSILNFYQRHAAKRMFSRWAPIYEEEVTENAYSAADEVARNTIKLLGQEDVQMPRIADIGIGTGLLAQQIYDSLPCRITGLDYTEDMMAQCAARDITELLIKCDAGCDVWPLEPAGYDAVVAAGLFEYLTEDMAAHFFEQARLCLKPNGLLVLTYVPVASGEKKTGLWRGHSGTYLVCRYAPEEMEEMLSRHGFMLIEHAAPFKGSVFHDGSSYDYRLVSARSSTNRSS